MTTTIALTQPHSWLARLRTIMVLRPGQRVVNVPGIGVSVSRRAVASGAAAWWLAGGAPTPVAVYQPKGAASLAASYVNLVNPGTYDAAPGVAPTLGADGWEFSASAYLTTDLVPASDQSWSALAAFNITSGSGVVLGCVNDNPYAGYHLWPAYGGGGGAAYGNSGGVQVEPPYTTGVTALAGNKAYRNGIAEAGTIGVIAQTITVALAIGARKRWDGVYDQRITGSIQAVAIWNTSTDHAIWMPAVSAAVALI